jgi:hypothetical protein
MECTFQQLMIWWVSLLWMHGLKHRDIVELWVRNSEFVYSASISHLYSLGFEKLRLELDNAAWTGEIGHHCIYSLRIKLALEEYRNDIDDKQSFVSAVLPIYARWAAARKLVRRATRQINWSRNGTPLWKPARTWCLMRMLFKFELAKYGGCTVLGYSKQGSEDAPDVLQYCATWGAEEGLLDAEPPPTVVTVYEGGRRCLDAAHVGYGTAVDARYAPSLPNACGRWCRSFRPVR